MHEELEAILGVHFRDPSLLTMALTHRSYIYEAAGAGKCSNERLEFLGDSILALISADFLYRTFPQLAEGELTDVRAILVRTETLAKFAREIQLNNYMLMGKGEQNSGGGQRVMASAFEAILGALYLDQGLEATQRFLLPRLEPIAHEIVKKRAFKDNKSLFQELAQAREGITPSYRLVSQEGPSHNREFTVEVLLGERVAGRGQGRNKQTAEQEAAHSALVNFGWI
ncbi:ribonuclease-3 [Thermosporothrix hazakensis]|jgi:ribonuclease-3|uniref:Ribonuclease 3 n=2 Tax=Thermosporothrix TaxID=768650 RepID=A0A326UBZ2_THEHA|nr:ribonuclease III [Thermosporothrix hazakensis]PZW33079.1 ribonuclease-3 [Thermosporothrix hazakensis]BBH91057.1 ribonuclease 3 [Thermosporothrix sp. COM3]GCE49110.1 ribonuclease 3 [Thermosporothrix hazakensis]